MPPPGPGAGDDAKELIRARVDLVEVVRERVHLQRRKNEFWGLCPFHEESGASFHVVPARQYWHCFGCDRGGDVFDFVELAEKVDFRKALEILADRAGVELRPADPREVERAGRRKRILEANRAAAQYYEYVLHSLEAGEPGRALLEQREVSEETARRFQLGFAPAGRGFADYLRQRQKPLADAIEAGLVRRDGTDFFRQRLLIPIRDERGQTLAFTGRTVEPDEPRKYVNSPDTDVYHKGRVLFALDLARGEIEKSGHGLLMEGQFDVITAHQQGVGNAVATSGTALSEDQLRLLRRFTDEVVLVFDGDDAGRKAAFRAVELASQQGLRTRVAQLPDAQDPDEFLRGAGEAAQQRWQEAMAAAPAGWELWIKDSIRGLNAARPNELETAVTRVRAVLARITDLAVRDSYRDHAAHWLNVDPRTMAEPGARPPAASARLAPPRPGNKATVEGRFLQVLALRPELAGRFRQEIPPEDLEDDLDRAAYAAMLSAVEEGGPEVFGRDLGALPERARELIHQAWISPLPGADDDAVVEDLLARVRGRVEARRRKGIMAALAEAEREGDSERVANLSREYLKLTRGT